MTLKLVPKEEQVKRDVQGRRRKDREKVRNKKELSEKRRIERIIANDAFNKIEQRNKELEGKY